jgi:basic amino acid/polyamine antiporter, APA family
VAPVPEENVARRQLGLVHVFAISTGAMFSSGFFLLPGLAADETGPSVPLAYLLAGVLALPAMLSTAELATAYPRAGGPYHFLQRSLGAPVAVIGALGLYVAMILKAAFALVGVGAYLTLVVDLPVEPVAVGLALAFTALNIAGARESATLQVALVGLLLAVLVAFVVTGVVEVTGTGATADGSDPFFADGSFGLLAATALVFVSFAGILQVASIGGEVRDPERTVPRGLLLALGTATTIYVAGTALMVAVLPMDDLRDDPTPVASAVEVFPLPFGLPLIVLAALAAFASTGNAGIMSASRYPVALARDGLLWGRLARFGRFGSPTWSVVLTGAITMALIVAFDVEGIAKLASAFVLVVFALLNLAVIVLRAARVAGYLPTFRAPLHPWLQVFGIVAAIVLVVDLGTVAIVFTLAVVAAGSVLYLAVGRGRGEGRGTALHLLHRLREGPLDDADLQRAREAGHRPDDRTADVLGRAAVSALHPEAEGADLARTCLDALADRLGVAPDETRGWFGGRGHLELPVDPDRVVVHHLVLDWAHRPEVAVAWAPATPSDTDDRPGARTARIVAVVAGPSTEVDRTLRIAGLLADQLGDGTVPWPEAAAGADTVRRRLVDGVTRPR